jgi:hypothetical protein
LIHGRRGRGLGDRRALHEAIGIALRLLDVWNGEIVHDLQGHAGLFLESGTRAAHGQHDEVDRPENGDGPEDCVAHGVTFAEDAAIPVDVVARYRDYARIDRDDGVRLNDHAVEAELHPAFADKVAGIFVVFKAAD